jgi:hypothetical protein
MVYVSSETVWQISGSLAWLDEKWREGSIFNRWSWKKWWNGCLFIRGYYMAMFIHSAPLANMGV